MTGVMPGTRRRAAESTVRTWDGTRDAESLPRKRQEIGEPDALKGASPVRRGADGQRTVLRYHLCKTGRSTETTAPRQPPTLPPVDANGYYDTDQEKVDFLFFGWVNGDFPELGYFSLSELESVNVMELGIERDLHFTPMRLSEVKQLHAETPPSSPPTLTIIIIDDLEEEGDPNGNS